MVFLDMAMINYRGSDRVERRKRPSLEGFGSLKGFISETPVPPLKSNFPKGIYPLSLFHPPGRRGVNACGNLLAGLLMLVPGISQ